MCKVGLSREDTSIYILVSHRENQQQKCGKQEPGECLCSGLLPGISQIRQLTDTHMDREVAGRRQQYTYFVTTL